MPDRVPTTRSLGNWVLALALLGAAGGCTGSRPCTQCPPVEGSYALAFDVPLNVSGTCPDSVRRLTEAGLVITRTDAQLTGEYLNYALSGTVYDTHQLSLQSSRSGLTGDGGTSSSDTLSFSFAYQAPTGTPPGPTRLTGTVTLTTTNLSGGGASCVQTGAVTASRP